MAKRAATSATPTAISSKSANPTTASRTAKRVLRRAELPADTAQLARFLIGKLLVRKLPEGIAAGRIVETEAYPVGDAAGHAYSGRTPRTAPLFLERGHAYVYLAYGTSFMLNVSSEKPGIGAGILIRAIEPTEGINIMEQNRGISRLRDLARGPGRLCQALDVDLRLNAVDLCKTGPLWLASDRDPAAEIGESKRIGITRAAGALLRFYQRDSPFVSGPKGVK
jgi:DNA-3-methyladenine glycosylase